MKLIHPIMTPLSQKLVFPPPPFFSGIVIPYLITEAANKVIEISDNILQYLMNYSRQTNILSLSIL